MTALRPLAETPPGELGAAWRAAVRALDPAAQDALLAQADAVRGDGDDGSWRALTTYRTLVDRALEGPRALARAVWMVDEDPDRDGVTRRFAEVARCAGGDAAAFAALLLAECDLHDGRADVAQRGLASVLAHAHGRGTRLEVMAWTSLAASYAFERRETEALLAARRADRLVDRATDVTAVDRAHVAAAVARAWFSLGDVDRLLAHLPRVRASADAMPPTDARRARFHAYLLVARAAVDAGRLEVARAHLALAEAEHRDEDGRDGHQPAAVATTRVRLARAEGDTATMAASIDEVAPQRPGVGNRSVAHLELVVALHALRGERAEAERRAAELLGALGDRQGVGPAQRLLAAEALGRLVGDRDLDPAIGTEAFRVAADAAFERLHELERATDGLVSLAQPTDDDRAALAEHRARALARHRAFAAQLRTRIEAAAAAGTLPQSVAASTGGLTTVCAWCLRVRDRGGRWWPVGHLLAPSDALPVTHGVCPDCRPLIVR